MVFGFLECTQSVSTKKKPMAAVKNRYVIIKGASNVDAIDMNCML